MMYASPINTPSVINGALYSKALMEIENPLAIQEHLKYASGAGEVVQLVKHLP